jgi:hypothetical protein
MFTRLCDINKKSAYFSFMQPNFKAQDVDPNYIQAGAM